MGSAPGGIRGPGAASMVQYITLPCTKLVVPARQSCCSQLYIHTWCSNPGDPTTTALSFGRQLGTNYLELELRYRFLDTAAPKGILWRKPARKPISRGDTPTYLELELRNFCRTVTGRQSNQDKMCLVKILEHACIVYIYDGGPDHC